jgi:N-acetylglucosaminyldiphosphoundecaprenol N-acetyl-beta-D-mannosaminyltransferase
MASKPDMRARSRPSQGAPPSRLASTTRVRVAGVGFNVLTEAQVIDHIITASLLGKGGWVATPNVDICRMAKRDPALHELVAAASLVVPDGMPLLWAARLRGDRIPERVTGSSLIFTLTEAAARNDRSIYLLGGEPGISGRAGQQLRGRYPGLRVAGDDGPPVGFDAMPGAVDAIRHRLVAAAPDIVYVGLGCPKQERLIAQLGPSLPAAWFVGCGAAIPFAAGALRRAPGWMQAAGLEWMFRLLREPRRLFKRYIGQDLPFVAALLASSAWRGVRARRSLPSIPAPALPQRDTELFFHLRHLRSELFADERDVFR